MARDTPVMCGCGGLRRSALLLLWLTSLSIYSLYSVAATPTAEFSRHHVTRPVLLHARHKRQAASTSNVARHTRRQDGLYAETATVSLETPAGPQVLDLRLNVDLLPTGHTVAEVRGDGTRHKQTPSRHEAELCQYRGVVRESPGSWVAVSTCSGLRGVFYDGRDVHYIEPADEIDSESEEWGKHYVYQHGNLLSEGEDLLQRARQLHNSSTHTRSKRQSDSSETLHGPYNANRKSRYVELALVADNSVYRDSGESLSVVHQLCKDIANIVNAMYAPLNIFIALVAVEVWTERDHINLVDNGDTTLNTFLVYRRNILLPEHYNDNAQLITNHRFDNGVVGKALKSMMCTYEYSGGITTNHSTVVGLVAATVAHEMGHNFGMEHDNEEDCHCASDKCIMSPSSNFVRPTHWSSCSQEALALSFERGLDYCLRNKPTALFESPTCGNGWVEPGEECDCGVDGEGSSCAACCHTHTCMLRSNATCATGECCDLNRCAVRPAGWECRSATQECDLPEFCTGGSEYCPRDVHKMDTLPCDGGAAYCHAGQCRSHTDQCKLLWGSSGMQSHQRCYEMNRNGSRIGNCGYDRVKTSYAKCAPEDVLCGMLHCRHLNEQLEFGAESVAIISHAFINVAGTIIPCRTALVDLGLQQVDPGLVPDGAKCGTDKMCVSQRCVSLESVRSRMTQSPSSVCPSDCSGHGVCNSKGSCHCDRGFAPPLCEMPGTGGSVHSGPATDPSVHRKFMVAIYVIFLGIVPAILLALLLLYYSRHNVLLWWKRPRKPGQSPRAGSLQRRLSRGASKLAASISQAASPRHAAPPTLTTPTDMSSSLLPPVADHAQFFGHFKGFSLAPIDTHEPAVAVVSCDEKIPPGSVASTGSRGAPAPVRSAPPPPAAAPAPPTATLRRTGSSVQSRIKALLGDKPTELPSVPTRPVERPTISSPVLEASTMAELAPIRPAPPAPAHKRPLSVEADVFLKPLPDEPAGKRQKEGMTLNRIASFLKQDKTRNPVERSHSLPRNQNQARVVRAVDKTALRNLQISSPILQKDIELPVGTVPVLPEGASEGDGKTESSFVGRAQSMRSGTLVKRPEIASFGSMRQPGGPRPAGGAGRPVSVAAPPARPTSPPPPAPTPQYADVTNEKQAPLADIEEVPGDNIYAVIEECVTSHAAPVRTTPQPPPAGYTAPRASRGDLLGEIVSEIQTRNLDSIYSTSTLARRKAAASGASSTGGTEGSYANSSAASTTSSGYLAPSAVNVPQHNHLTSKDTPKVPVMESSPQSTRTTVTSKIPTFGRQPTPPSLRTSSFRSAPAPPSPKPTPAVNNPDVVSSCAPSNAAKSPDVVHNSNSSDPKSATKTPKPADKPKLDKKNGVKPNPLPKAVANADKLGSVQKIQTGKVNVGVKSELSKAKPRPGVRVPSGAATKPVTAPRPAATPRVASNVASLQQKFENRKPGGNKTTNNS